MPVNHALRIIFVHIPKTGGTAVESALGMHGTVSTVGIIPYHNQQKDYNCLFGRGLQHLTALEIDGLLKSLTFNDYSTFPEFKRIIDKGRKILKLAKQQDYFKKYFSFTVVRNPYDRLVSYWAWKKKNSGNKNPLTPEEFAENMTMNWRNDLLFRKHLMPQHKFLTIGGKIVINKILKFENLVQEFITMCDDLGLPCTGLEFRMVSSHLPFSEYYSEKLQENVYEIYRDDFTIFGYPKEFK